MEKNLIDTMNELLNSSDKWVIQDEKGNIHELNEGIAGIPVQINSVDELKKLLGLGERISSKNLIEIKAIFDKIIVVLKNNASYQTKVKFNNEIQGKVSDKVKKAINEDKEAKKEKEVKKK